MRPRKARLGASAAAIAAGVVVALALARCAPTRVAAPGAEVESADGWIASDTPPRGLPAGTVTYEVWDSAAGMRYWVFLWPDGSRSVTPRLTVKDGRIVPYTVDDHATVTSGTVEVKVEEGERDD